MRLKEVQLKRFKRFSDTTITNLPDTARLVIIAGPNGSGKSSFFESLNVWQRQHHFGVRWDDGYYVKRLPDMPDLDLSRAVKVHFHGGDPKIVKKAVYIRSAYRNDPEFELQSINRLGFAIDENRLPTLVQNDATVGTNYQRLASQALEDAFDAEDEATTIGEFRQKVIGEIKAATIRLFPDLIMNSLGNPLAQGTFRFDKGGAHGFSYKNLSGGEKAAFDLLLDILVKRREYDDTVFCIDEPETHMNTRLHGPLLRELYDVIGSNSQLWLSTHSVGMMRAARDLAAKKRDEVVFLDFGNRDFDQPQVITPEKPTRAFWDRVLQVGFDDFAALIAPSEVIVCEGAPLGGGGPASGLDAKIYEIIFADEFPETRFITSGNSRSVEGDRLALVEAMQALVTGTKVRRLIDRDEMSDEDVSERTAAGLAVLGRRHLESYLFDDEIIRALASKAGQPDKADELILAKQELLNRANADPERRRPMDDVKASAGPLATRLRHELGLRQSGGSVKEFMRATMAPLVTTDTATYRELRASVFP